jgi:hypothetical protein
MTAEGLGNFFSGAGNGSGGCGCLGENDFNFSASSSEDPGPFQNQLNALVGMLKGAVMGPAQSFNNIVDDSENRRPPNPFNYAVVASAVAFPGEGGTAAEFGNAVRPLADLAMFRAELGLELPTAGATTLSRLDVGGESFYGISGHGQPITFPVNAVSRTHAEADAFQQAINAGVNSRTGTLYIDNVNGLCGYCTSSGIKSMMNASGISSLKIVTSKGITIIEN